MSIKSRMIGLTLIFAATLLTLLAVNIQTSRVQERAVALATEYATFQAEAQSVEAGGLRMRQAEKNFLLDRQIRYRHEFVSLFEDMLSNLTDLETLPDENGRRLANDLDGILTQYRSEFLGIVALMNDIGLTADEGLEGRLRESVHKIEEILDQHVDKDLKILMLQMRRHEKDFIARLDPKYIKRIGLRETEFMARLADVRFANAIKGEIETLLISYVRAFNEFAAKRLELIAAIDRLELVYNDSRPLYPALVAHADKEFERASAQIKEATLTAQSWNWGISTLALVLVAMLGYTIIITTVNPITRLEAAVNRIASGEYDVEVPGGRYSDEMGSVSRAMTQLRDSAAERQRLEADARANEKQQAAREREEEKRQQETERRRYEEEAQTAVEREARAEKLRAMVQGFETRIAQFLVQLGNASADMTDNAQAMYAIAQTNGAAADSVSSAAHTMSDAIASNASAVTEFAASISEVNSQVRGANDLCDEAAALTEEGEKSITAMAESAEQVKGVIAIINDIAEQTNLLALNATIEAARAGDAGRGFAVVASEVKSLSTQTADATKRVEQEVGAMRDSVSATVEKMASIRKAIDQLTTNMNGIASASVEQEATTQELSRSSELSSGGAESVTAEIADVQLNAKKARDISGAVRKAAEDLTRLGGDMSTEITGFLSDVRNR